MANFIDFELCKGMSLIIDLPVLAPVLHVVIPREGYPGVLISSRTGAAKIPKTAVDCLNGNLAESS